MQGWGIKHYLAEFAVPQSGPDAGFQPESDVAGLLNSEFKEIQELRESAGIPSAHGFMLGASKTTDDQRWMGFVRAGWSKGSAPIYNETYSLGIVRRVRRNSDEIGFAINWGDPPDNSLSSQTTGELFYRLQLSQGLAITPSIQLLKDPALNDQHGHVWVYGIRMRLTL